MGEKGMATESSMVGIKKKHTESAEQIAAMDWLRSQFPEVAEHTMHIGNERKSSLYMGAIMKKMGVLKGASDIFMAWPCGKYHGLFIEVKSLTGRASPEQKAFIQRMRNVGYKAEICHGAEAVISTMREYLFTKGCHHLETQDSAQQS